MRGVQAHEAAEARAAAAALQALARAVARLGGGQREVVAHG